jgi:hypothetical protein
LTGVLYYRVDLIDEVVQAPPRDRTQNELKCLVIFQKKFEMFGIKDIR